MPYLNNKLNGLKRRIRCIKYGMFYTWNKDFQIPNKIIINGIKKELQFKDLNAHEFLQICINDCYHLKYLKNKLKDVYTILDIGANQGVFLVAARQYFPKANICAYEPNHLLETYLSHNAQQVNAEVYYEAVMKNSCMVDLNYTESDLATSVFESNNGSVKGKSFREVIQEIGRPLDILKMDCEGTEWDLLKDLDTWDNIKYLTFEYHLWAKSEAKMEDLFKLLEEINFKVIFHNIHNDTQGIILACNNKFTKN